MKSPPVQYSDDVARQMVEEFIHSVASKPEPRLSVRFAG
jgi:hypothetical protein